MFKIIVLICSMTTIDCDQNNAIDVVATARASTAQQCGFMGQSILAPTTIAPIPGKQYMKILCLRERD